MPYFEADFGAGAHESAHEFRSDEVHTECVYHTLKVSQKYRNFDDFAEIGFERGAFCACAYVHTKNGSFPALCIITKTVQYQQLNYKRKSSTIFVCCSFFFLRQSYI